MNVAGMNNEYMYGTYICMACMHDEDIKTKEKKSKKNFSKKIKIDRDRERERERHRHRQWAVHLL